MPKYEEVPDFVVDNLNRLADKKNRARTEKHKPGRDLSKALDKEANTPIRKTESGRYEGQDMSNLNAAGNDEDGEYLKKRK